VAPSGLNLRDVLADADRRRVAVGHFNVSDLAALKGVVAAAAALRLPVLVGVSEGERDFVGVREIAALIRTIRAEHPYPIFLNADHTHSLSRAEEAARAGFDEIIFDGSALPFDENVRETKRAVEAIRAIDSSIVIEGEIGYIGTSSAVLTEVPKGMGDLTTPVEAREFVRATGIDVLAPAVGNMHGMLASMVRGDARKRLDIERIKAIKDETGVLMTLHGGSGTDDEDFRRAIKAGMTIVHINTELRLAWRRSIESALAQHPDEVAPYKILPDAVKAVQEVVTGRLRLFSS
jgi:fructose-bisphosphate aldolase, class II